MLQWAKIRLIWSSCMLWSQFWGNLGHCLQKNIGDFLWRQFYDNFRASIAVFWGEIANFLQILGENIFKIKKNVKRNM
jgi:hypothetical protein